MTPRQEVGRLGVRRDRDLDRVAAVGGRDPGRDPLAGVDRGRVGGAEPGRLAGGRDQRQAELVGALLGERQADLPACVRDHEVDRLGGRELRGDDEVALVLAVGIVDDDDDATLANLLDRILDRRERCRDRHGRRLARGAQQESLDVLREHVDLEVDEPSARELAERRRRERVRDQGDREAVLVERRRP